MTQSESQAPKGATSEAANSFELNLDVDAKFKAEQTAIDNQTPSEFESVLKHLEDSAAHFKKTLPDFVCHLTRESDSAATFTYKETDTSLKLVKEHLSERGRDYAVKIVMPNGKENNYRPYKHEEGLVWICDHKSGEDLVGTSKDFASKLVEKCSRG